ncbi:hypothetical protein MXD63_14720 [Frankia sp. Cpl3]|nr:hypothetical protein [Frankia sp. Cpl3]
MLELAPQDFDLALIEQHATDGTITTTDVLCLVDQLRIHRAALRDANRTIRDLAASASRSPSHLPSAQVPSACADGAVPPAGAHRGGSEPRPEPTFGAAT